MLSVLISLSLFASHVISNACADTHYIAKKDISVYTTKTGSKYHTPGCRYLSKSAYKTTKKEARAGGYEACKICKP